MASKIKCQFTGCEVEVSNDSEAIALAMFQSHMLSHSNPVQTTSQRQRLPPIPRLEIKQASPKRIGSVSMRSGLTSRVVPVFRMTSWSTNCISVARRALLGLSFVNSQMCWPKAKQGYLQQSRDLQWSRLWPVSEEQICWLPDRLLVSQSASFTLT